MKKIFGMFIMLLSLLLFKGNIYAYEEYKVGDLIEYRSEYYFVIEDSDKETNYVTLLKYEPLKQEEIYIFSDGQFNDDKIIASQPCEGNDYNQGKCDSRNYYSADYDDSYIKFIVDNWSESFQDDLVGVDGYKARILTSDDMKKNLGYEDQGSYYRKTYTTPTWVYSSSSSGDAYSYWILSDKSQNNFYYINCGDKSSAFNEYSKSIRPVINLKKSVSGICKKNYTIDHKNKYQALISNNLGSGLSYNNVGFDIYEDSDENQSYVILITTYSLSAEDINKYSGGEYNSDKVPYYVSDTCNKNNITGCTTDYNKSIVKGIVDNWANDKFGDNDLVSIDGYKTRLITIDELVGRFGYESGGGTGISYQATENTSFHIYDFQRNNNTFSRYWTMSQSEDSEWIALTVGSGFYENHYSYIYYATVYDSEDTIDFKSGAAIRPIVNIDKCALGEWACWSIDNLIVEDECITDGVNHESSLTCKEYKTKQVIHYNKFKIGRKVEYNGERYYVIEESDASQNYLTLLKDKPLTKDELYKYGRDKDGKLFINEYSINTKDPEKVVYEYEDGTGGMAYYTSETCSYNYFYNGSIIIKNNIIDLGCNINYDNSDVKKVVDNWSKDVFEDKLVDVDGYEARLLLIDDLVNNLGYEYVGYATDGSIVKTSSTPKWVYDTSINMFSHYSYWTMTYYDDNSIYNINMDYYEKGRPTTNLMFYSAVRPVVNVDKCAIDGGCDIEEVTVEVDCNEDDLTDGTPERKKNDIKSIVVAVGNTLKKIPMSILIICSILIIGGIYFLISSYIKSKKELKK